MAGGRGKAARRPGVRSAAVEKWEPIRIDPEAEPEEPEREPLFYVGDTEYTVPKKLSPRLALQALRMARVQGEAAASYWAVEQAVGPDTIDALVESPASDEQIDAILQELGRRYMGQARETLGKQ